MKKDETNRQKENREEIWSTINGLYVNKNNAGGFGNNGWSMFNAVGEYLDHYRKADSTDRAYASMDMYSWVTKTKAQTESYILSLV